MSSVNHSLLNRWFEFGDGFRIGRLPHTTAATGYGATTTQRQNNPSSPRNRVRCILEPSDIEIPMMPLKPDQKTG